MLIQFLPDVDFENKKINWKIYLKDTTNPLNINTAVNFLSIEQRIEIFIRWFLFKACLSVSKNKKSEIQQLGASVIGGNTHTNIMNLPDILKTEKKINSFGESPICYPDTLFGIKFNIRVKIIIDKEAHYLLITTSGETDLDIPQILRDVQFSIIKNTFFK